MTGTPAAGTLTVVATSLGNAADLSPRAISVLREADVIVAEDTRSARQLLLGIGAAAPPADPVLLRRERGRARRGGRARCWRAARASR